MSRCCKDSEIDNNPELCQHIGTPFYENLPVNEIKEPIEIKLPETILKPEIVGVFAIQPVRGHYIENFQNLENFP